jgi:hypothetical protein
LPAIGLFLFSAESYHSVRTNREVQHTSSRYFWWSSVRLDSDPLNRHPEAKGATPCKNGEENCVTWELRYIWVDPALLTRFLMLSAFPAFVVGGLAVGDLGRLGISELSTFMLLMPVLIVAWYYFVGWLLDRWLGKRRQQSAATA